MKLGRIEFGFVRSSSGCIDTAEISIERSSCGCTIFTIGWFYLTYLRGGCISMNELEMEVARSVSRVHFLLVLKALDIISQEQFTKLYKGLRHDRGY